MPIHWGSNTIDDRGNTQIVIQDQFTQFFDFRLAANPGNSSVATATAIESRTLIVADASSASVGDYAVVFPSPYGYSTEIYVGKIFSIATNTLTMDTPINRVYAIGDIVLFRDSEIALANGSVTPVIYDLPLPAGNISLDVTRFIFSIISATEPDDSLFGDIAALTNGIVIRHNSTQFGIRNIWNAKTNGDLAVLAYEVTYTDKAGGGAFGTRVLLTLNAQAFHGVTIRMLPGDSIELIVQDDLTALNSFQVVVQGHVVN